MYTIHGIVSKVCTQRRLQASATTRLHKPCRRRDYKNGSIEHIMYIFIQADKSMYIECYI